MLNNSLQKIQVFIIKLISKIHWRQRSSITKNDDLLLKEMFLNNYYIILTRKRNHLSTFFISLGNFFLTRRWGFYSHILMNLENSVTTDDDYRFIEATGIGTHYSTYEDVFSNIDAVALIKPRNISISEWTTALDAMPMYLGTPYDNLFDLKNEKEINCVELVWLALRKTENYNTNFSEFEKMVSKRNKLTPDMFIACSDFEVVYQIER